MECSCFKNTRSFYLGFIIDLIVTFIISVENSENTSFASSMDCEKFILRYVYIFLLGGIKKAFTELNVDENERGRLTDLLLSKSAESPVPYIVGLAEYLTLTIPFISSSFKLLMDRYNDQTNNQERRRRTDMT